MLTPLQNTGSAYKWFWKQLQNNFSGSIQEVYFPITFWILDFFFSIMKTRQIFQVVTNREKKCSPLSWISDFSQLYKNVSDVKPRRFLPSETKPSTDPNGKMEASTSHQDKLRSFTALACHSGTGLARGYAPIWPSPCLGKAWLLTWTDRSSLSWKVEEKPSSSLAWLYQKKLIEEQLMFKNSLNRSPEIYQVKLWKVPW